MPPNVSSANCLNWSITTCAHAPRQVVVVTGVGGTDTRSRSHKHASHTKGGTSPGRVCH
jgi:hypothetical protein